MFLVHVCLKPVLCIYSIYSIYSFYQSNLLNLYSIYVKAIQYTLNIVCIGCKLKDCVVSPIFLFSFQWIRIHRLNHLYSSKLIYYLSWHIILDIGRDVRATKQKKRQHCKHNGKLIKLLNIIAYFFLSTPKCNYTVLNVFINKLLTCMLDIGR